MKSLKNKYHRDGTVTFWDVYSQTWTRKTAAQISDETLATMTEAERARIERHAAKHA